VGLIAGSPVEFASGALSLEGILHLPEGSVPFPGSVVCHPHPRYGGDMHNNVVGVLVRSCLDSGIAALRFNFRGTGASEGAYEGGGGEICDIGAAIAYLQSRPEIGSSRTVLAGYSFGAAMALGYAMAHPGLAAVVAVSPPTVAGIPAGPAVTAPLLLAAGDRDDFCDTGLLSRLGNDLGIDTELQVMDGVDHFWWGSEARLESAVTDFLARVATNR
jgi:alpha/beta superfamily hydrolase